MTGLPRVTDWISKTLFFWFMADGFAGGGSVESR